MLRFDAKGIYCEQAGLYIDPWQPVDKALITHAHADHARPGSKAYLCHHDSVAILKLRLGADIRVEGVGYGEVFTVNGVRISLHPAGHIIGSAQIRLEYKGEVWVVSGDYKLQADGVSVPFEPLRCHHFITESTFGLPVYKFPQPAAVHEAINTWWRDNAAAGINSVIIGYALGKAQRILAHLDPDAGPVYTHGAVDNIHTLLAAQGLVLPPARRVTPDMQKKDIQGAMIIAPPSAIGTSWMNRFAPFSLGICSGWMQLRGTRRRRSADRGFILSDHADWDQLNEAVKATGAEHVYVTHGYKPVYARWLREAYGLDAAEVETLYDSGQEDVVPGAAGPGDQDLNPEL
ncbi:ligase-associated DNA damage response exonuclease [Taibaiella chishuiensis]|uniref:Putative mRNA 3-end processing factor n=1 Tax=Taibaiella chishuiensis TaxID=1434707 RepID=A0A2P8D1B8_9BACT|nr:ligase-associated DNA damage response exonuclease [Taibaiella chishuiensis]PSK91001.1 putative mRNA 3-end processing factor [Taibaiella chishuiensis]